MDINLFFNDSPGHKEIATAVQAQWKELGISSTLKQQEWAQYLEFLGPPPNNAVDVYRLGWIYDYPDAINGLDLWTCDSGNNNTNYCDKSYDDLVAQARETPDDTARYDIYAQLEDKLFGQDGALPILPIYWYTYPEPREALDQGHVQHQPARPVRPHPGGGEGLAGQAPDERGASAPPPDSHHRCELPQSGKHSDLDGHVHHPKNHLDDPGHLARHLHDVRDDEADRRQSPQDGEERAAGDPANLERKFNLDKPWYQQYAYYVKDVATLDLGPSMSQRTRTVNDIIKDGFPKSLKLGILAFLWAVVLGIPLGVLAALKPNSIFDYFAMFFSSHRLRVAELLRRHAADLLRGAESGSRAHEQMAASFFQFDNRVILPSFALGLFPMAYFARLVAARCSRPCSRTTCAPRGRRVAYRRVIGLHVLRTP